MDAITDNDYSELNLPWADLEQHRINELLRLTGVLWVSTSADRCAALIIKDNEKFVLTKLEYG